MGIVCIIILAAYLAWTTARCGGIAGTLSETYYWMDKQGWVFQAMLFALAGLLLPSWLDASPEEITCLPFLTCTSIVIVALFPKYKEGTDRKIHLTAAYTSAALLVLWLVLAGLWFYIIYGIAFILLSASISRLIDGKYHWWYWMEVAAFLTASIAVV